MSNIVLKKIKVISARSGYEDQYPGNENMNMRMLTNKIKYKVIVINGKWKHF